MIQGGPATQTDQAFRLLEEKIVTGELAPGSFLTEKEICALVGFGRTPVREAILRLGYGLLLQVMPRRGIRIAPVEYHETIMAIEVRIALERLLMEKAIENSGAFEKKRFRKFAEDIRKTKSAADSQAFARADDELNRFIAATSRHQVAAQHSIPLHALTRRLGYLDTALRGPDAMLRSASFHAELCDALADGDLAAAHRSLQNLFDLNMEILEHVVGSISSAAAE
jgi:DNA-binding GntR family transcriptional regulator